MLIHLRIEQTLSSPFGVFPIPLILRNVGNHPVIEAHPSSVLGVEGTVCVEIRSLDDDPLLLDRLEGILKMDLQFERIVVVTRNDSSGSKDIPLPLYDR